PILDFHLHHAELLKTPLSNARAMEFFSSSSVFWASPFLRKVKLPKAPKSNVSTIRTIPTRKALKYRLRTGELVRGEFCPRRLTKNANSVPVPTPRATWRCYGKTLRSRSATL